MRQLLFLRLVGLALPCADDLQHVGRFSDRAANHSGVRQRQPQKMVKIQDQRKDEPFTPESGNVNRRKWFIFSLLLNFSILGTFKYFNFFVGSFTGALGTLGIHNIPLPLILVILPPGISFYTFQEVAYIVDVYKGRLEPAKSFVDYGLFVSLFPHLIAGPIQRPGHLLPQVQNERSFDADRFFDGLMLIFSGLLRKCVVADNCALLANAAFGEIGRASCRERG